MSTKSTIFLTNDNEHCYDDCRYQHSGPDGKWIGNTIIVEFDKKNVRILSNNDDDLIIAIDPGSELYEIFNSLSTNKELAKFR